MIAPWRKNESKTIVCASYRNYRFTSTICYCNSGHSSCHARPKGELEVVGSVGRKSA